MNRRRDRSRDRRPRPAPDTTPTPATDGGGERALVIQADPFRVQQADFTLCTVPGCPTIAIPEDWEVVDLDTGDELPMRLCDEHQLAYLRH